MGLDQQRWIDLWRSAVMWAESIDPFSELQRRYSEPTRRYHNTPHIVECLKLFDEVKAVAADPVALELAIWFHDAIYDPRANDNEDRSGVLAADLITRAGGTPELAARVRALVLATKTHEPGVEPDAPWILDIDLAILGQRAEVFDAYETAIRAEYAWVESAMFCAKRAQVLAGFLARPRIYLTSFFGVRLETTARKNIQRSIDRLRGGPQSQ